MCFDEVKQQNYRAIPVHDDHGQRSYANPEELDVIPVHDFPWPETVNRWMEEGYLASYPRLADMIASMWMSLGIGRLRSTSMVYVNIGEVSWSTSQPTAM